MLSLVKFKYTNAYLNGIIKDSKNKSYKYWYCKFVTLHTKPKGGIGGPHNVFAGTGLLPDRYITLAVLVDQILTLT